MDEDDRTTRSAGDVREVLRPDRTALLVVDMQKDLMSDRYDTLLGPTAELLAHARRVGVLVIFVRNTVLPNGASTSPAEHLRRQRHGLVTEVTVAGTDGHRVIDALAPLAREPQVYKHRLDSFHGTNLDQLLRVRGIETVVITGVATHGCVSATSYSAQARDYNVVVAQDCVGSWTKDLHDSALQVLTGFTSFVLPSGDIVGAWKDSAPTRALDHQKLDNQ
jgi:nicotinamidase-related amidase